MNEGSHTGHVALKHLAATQGISPITLWVALEQAFDIMKQNDNSCLSLQIALARLGYSVSSQALYGCLRAFRSAFGDAFNKEQGERWQHLLDIFANGKAPLLTPYHPATQTQPSPYRLQAMAPPRVAYPAPQYTPDAMIWHSGIHEPQVPEEVDGPQSTPSQYNPEPIIPQPTPSNHCFERNT
jgi:hypothetical protein